MSVIISIIAFVFLLSFLVLLHEFGHYSAARKCGVVVEEFGFGLPPRAVTLFERHGTKFSLNWIPFGGFVRMKGENAEETEELNAPGSFASASIPARILILVAGVMMNFVLAIIIFTIGFSVGRWVPTYVSLEDMQVAAERGEISMVPRVLITDVDAAGTAAAAGVPKDALLVTVNGQPVGAPEEVSALQKETDEVRYVVRTGELFDQEQTYTVPVRDGMTGISIAFFPEVSAPTRSIPSAFLFSLREAQIMTVQTVLGMAHLFSSLAQRGTVPQGVTGIVGIAQLTYASVQEGFMTYLRLVALLSLSLAILNILPFPALDGGRLMFVFVEAIRRRPANRRFELITNMIGFAVLIGLIVVITYFDIIRLILPNRG